MRLGYRAFTLANGLRVVLHRNDHMPLISMTIAYNVGSKDERPGRTGFAHLFEHLMFDGSKNVPRGMFDVWCETAGGHNNAYTSEDKTVYYLALPAHRLELGLWLESDRLAALDLTPEGLETQRSVVMEEKRQRVDNQPYGRFDTRMPALLFGAHPYGHAVIGSMDDIAAATMDDVTAFHRAYYRPDNAALVIAGDIDPDRTESLVDAWFGSIPSLAPAPPVAAGDPPSGEMREVIHDDVPLPGVFIGYRLPAEQERGYQAADLVSDILGSGDTSRLHRGLVYDRRIASHASAYVDGRRLGGMLVVYAMATAGHTAEELEAALREELSRLQLSGIEEAELEKTRNRVLAAHFQNLQSMTARGDRFAHHALFDDNPALVETLIDEYLELGADDIAAAARTFLVPENSAVLHFLPKIT